MLKRFNYQSEFAKKVQKYLDTSRKNESQNKEVKQTKPQTKMKEDEKNYKTEKFCREKANIEAKLNTYILRKEVSVNNI